MSHTPDATGESRIKASFVEAIRSLVNGSKFDLTDSPKSLSANVVRLVNEYDRAIKAMPTESNLATALREARSSETYREESAALALSEIEMITAEPITTHEQLEAVYQQAIRGRHISEIAPVLALRNKALDSFFPSSIGARAPHDPDDIGEWMAHMDLHLTEHDLPHAGMALRAAWPHVSVFLQGILNERYTWRELAQKSESDKNWLRAQRDTAEGKLSEARSAIAPTKFRAAIIEECAKAVKEWDNGGRCAAAIRALASTDGRATHE